MAPTVKYSKCLCHVIILLSCVTYRHEVLQHSTSYMNKNQKNPKPFILVISLQKPQKLSKDKINLTNRILTVYLISNSCILGKPVEISTSIINLPSYQQGC